MSQFIPTIPLLIGIGFHAAHLLIAIDMKSRKATVFNAVCIAAFTALVAKEFCSFSH